MLPKELIKAVKRLEIIARRAVNDQLAGQYHSVFKGQGIDFADVREYQPGDDIRVIDWKVSARTETLFVKEFIEERELTVFLVVDISGSQGFGTQRKLKKETAAEIAALLAFSAVSNNDRVGLLTFTDEVETFIPPKKGRKHVLRVISEILNAQPTGERTDIDQALQYLSRVLRKRAVVFIISDFLADDFETALSIAHRRHEIIPVTISDPMEQTLPNLGLVEFEDPETGERLLVDTSSPTVRSTFQSVMAKQRRDTDQIFSRLKMRAIEIDTSEDYVEPLIRYFAQRKRRQG